MKKGNLLVIIKLLSLLYNIIPSAISSPDDSSSEEESKEEVIQTKGWMVDVFNEMERLKSDVPIQKCGWYLDEVVGDLTLDIDQGEDHFKNFKNHINQNEEFGIEDSNNSEEVLESKRNIRDVGSIPWNPPEDIFKGYHGKTNFVFSKTFQNWCETKKLKIYQRSKVLEDHDSKAEFSSPDTRFVYNITIYGNGSLTWIDPQGAQNICNPKQFCVINSTKNPSGFEICQNNIPEIKTSEPNRVFPKTSEMPSTITVLNPVNILSNDYLKLQKCGWYPKESNFTEEQARNYSAHYHPKLWQYKKLPGLTVLNLDGGMKLDIFLGPPNQPNNWICTTNMTFKIVPTPKTANISTKQYDMKEETPDVRFVEYNITLYANGSLTWIDIRGFHHFRNKDDFCVVDSNFSSDSKLEFEICQSECTNEMPCVPKCCPESHVIDSEKNKCIPTETYWDPTFYQEVKDSTKRPYSLHIGLPDCTRTYLIQSNVDHKYPNLLLNGTLFLVNGNNQHKRTQIDNGQFCIDGIYSSMNPSNGTIVNYSRSEWDQAIIGCSRDRPEIPVWMALMYATVNHIAALFLFLTALVYLLLWSHQNIHGWLQFSYILSLFFAFSFLAIVQIWSHEIHNLSPDICAYLGWLIHLSFLSAFFWLTSMNFDLWIRFRYLTLNYGRRMELHNIIISSGNRSLRRIRSKPYREHIQRFFLFALFSVGIPCLFSGSAVALDHIYRGRPEDSPIKLPSFGASKCYFEDKASQFPFLYGPVGVLLLINLIFFTSTVMHLRKIHSNTELARSHSTLEDKKGVRLIAKLFIVMGVLWVFEFISYIFHVLFPKSEILLIWLFMPTDILNSLQGIAIFVIFICKPNVLSMLKAKYKWRTDEKTHTQNSNSVKP